MVAVWGSSPPPPPQCSRRSPFLVNSLSSSRTTLFSAVNGPVFLLAGSFPPRLLQVQRNVFFFFFRVGEASFSGKCFPAASSFSAIRLLSGARLRPFLSVAVHPPGFSPYWTEISLPLFSRLSRNIDFPERKYRPPFFLYRAGAWCCQACSVPIHRGQPLISASRTSFARGKPF